MRTVIADDAAQSGTTQMDCTSLPTIIRQSFGPGAEEEVAALLQRINDLIEDVQDMEIRLQQEATTRYQADTALAAEVGNALDYIQQIKLAMDQQIQNLITTLNALRAIFPKVVMTGVINGTGSVQRPAGTTIDFTDTRYVIQITPEGEHEGWSISRQAESFSVNVWSRSGTNRVGYGGNINYTVVQQSAIL